MKPNETLSNPTKLGKKNSVKLSALCITDWTNEDIENNDSMVFIFAYYICITEFLPSFAQNFIAHQWNIVRLEIFHRLKKKFQKTVRILFFSFLSFNSQADPVLPSFYWFFFGFDALIFSWISFLLIWPTAPSDFIRRPGVESMASFFFVKTNEQRAKQKMPKKK